MSYTYSLYNALLNLSNIVHFFHNSRALRYRVKIAFTEPKPLESARHDRIQGNWRTYLDEQEHKSIKYNVKESNQANNRYAIAWTVRNKAGGVFYGLSRLDVWETHFKE
jgi:hypothetical protein